ncbi:hypothetical protein ACFQBQ_06370 [Granulicella cerasi]|uniref:Uncharacterized protein n=1 Tax=Granulicella cerasi TaxID=741063 RepID=A0ABW1Z7X6_9BACT|nr:hypothetical protein [Granulicella cerasi]
MPLASSAQQPLAQGLGRHEGTDAESGIRYVRISMNGALTKPTDPPITTHPAAEPNEQLPTLVGECSVTPQGKAHFDLFLNAGGVADPGFVPPWKPTAAHPVQPPPQKTMLTLEFLGYRKVKPVARQFEKLRSAPGEFRYLSPGIHSANLEEINFYFLYLRALPTLRASNQDFAVDFAVTDWLNQLAKEPLCGNFHF